MKLRIDRVVGGPEERPIERWELLAGGRLVLTLEAADLHALAAEAMRADGQRQGLELAATYPDVLEADVRGSVEGLEARPQCHACGATRGLVVCRVCGQVVCQEHARLHRHEK